MLCSLEAWLPTNRSAAWFIDVAKAIAVDLATNDLQTGVLGADLVVHSATKYLTGNGTVTGGIVVDSGKFDWTKSGKFPSLSEPEPAYHGLAFHPALGAMAFTFHSIAIGLRDLGMTMNPQGAHYTLMGIETLSLRMERHVANARKIAEWLEKDPRVDYVTYAGLPSSPYNHRVARICPKGAGALFTFAVKGGYDACVKLIDNLKLFSHVANLGDTRSLIISWPLPVREG